MGYVPWAFPLFKLSSYVWHANTRSLLYPHRKVRIHCKGLSCTRTGKYAYITRAFNVPAQESTHTVYYKGLSCTRESTHTLQGPFLYPHRKVRINYRELAAVTLACYWLNRALAYHIPAMRKVAVRTRLYRNTQCGIHKFGMRKSVSQVGNWFKSRR